MQINMTLVVQALHFIIAYTMLRRLLFRPVITVIEQETLHTDALVSAIESRTVIVQEKTRDCKERWAHYQKEMRAHVPSIDQYDAIIQHIAPVYTAPYYSPEQIKKVTHTVATALTEKVKHVIE